MKTIKKIKSIFKDFNQRQAMLKDIISPKAWVWTQKMFNKGEVKQNGDTKEDTGLVVWETPENVTRRDELKACGK